MMTSWSRWASAVGDWTVGAWRTKGNKRSDPSMLEPPRCFRRRRKRETGPTQSGYKKRSRSAAGLDLVRKASQFPCNAARQGAAAAASGRESDAAARHTRVRFPSVGALENWGCAARGGAADAGAVGGEMAFPSVRRLSLIASAEISDLALVDAVMIAWPARLDGSCHRLRRTEETWRFLVRGWPCRSPSCC